MTRTHYDDELESVRCNLIQMGETTESLVGEALQAVAEFSPASQERASQLEAQTDHHHRMIHDQCLTLITRRAPVARDARLITGVLDAIVDLELIGDYAFEIVTLTASIKNRPPSQIAAQMAKAGGRIQEVLRTAIDNWRNRQGVPAQSVRSEEAGLRAECTGLYEKLSQLTSLPGAATTYVDLMVISRHLERILRHAVCVADAALSAVPADPVHQEA